MDKDAIQEEFSVYLLFSLRKYTNPGYQQTNFCLQKFTSPPMVPTLCTHALEESLLGKRFQILEEEGKGKELDNVQT